MQDDHIDRYKQAAKAAREKATKSDDPTQWRKIAETWDQLAHLIEAESLISRKRLTPPTCLVRN
jgi:hypothetical protein